ncbi:MAG: hypothetical protein IKZ88_04190 [Neisseriaceae bacterium]|nr:hypothetical protein [Neisseriaceae bacterium]
MSNEQWVLCFALRQNGYILDNASIFLCTCLKMKMLRWHCIFFTTFSGCLNVFLS